MKTSKPIPGTGWSDKPNALDRARDFIEDGDENNVEKETTGISGTPDARRRSRDRSLINIKSGGSCSTGLKL